MTDRELLEFSAKAAGLEAIWDCAERGMMMATASGIDTMSWNPLTDDGDALRLAVKLRLEWYFTAKDVVVRDAPLLDATVLVPEPLNDDPYAATRRAIVRAAAEIGRSMS